MRWSIVFLLLILFGCTNSIEPDTIECPVTFSELPGIETMLETVPMEIEGTVVKKVDFADTENPIDTYYIEYYGKEYQVGNTGGTPKFKDETMEKIAALEGKDVKLKGQLISSGSLDFFLIESCT